MIISRDKLMQDEKITEILSSDKFREVYGKLKEYVNAHYTKEEVSDKIIDDLFLEYLENSTIPNVTELTLLDIHTFLSLSDYVLNRLYDKDLNLSKYGPTSVGKIDSIGKDWEWDLLGLRLLKFTRNPVLLQKLMKKIYDVEYDGDRSKAKMGAQALVLSIIANRFDWAQAILDRNEYSLIPLRTIISMQKQLKRDGYILDCNYNPINSDMLNRALLELTMAESINKNKTDLAKKILYGDAVRVFNVDTNLVILEDLLSPDDFLEFINYLSNKSNKGEILLFKQDRSYGSTGGRKFDYVDSNELERIVSRDMKKPYSKVQVWKIDTSCKNG